MVDQLRRRLARRMIHAKDTAKRQAHQALMLAPPHLPTSTHANLAHFDLSSPSAIMATMNDPAFVNALSLDWKVGCQSWRNLNDELKRQLQDVRDQHLPPPSGGDIHQNRNRMGSQTPTDNLQRGNKDVIKASSPVTNQKATSKIPMQHTNPSANLISTEDEDVQTFLSMMHNTKCEFQSNVSTQAHTECLAMLFSHTQDLCIPDGGADSHVGGKTWLTLTPLSCLDPM